MIIYTSMFLVFISPIILVTAVLRNRRTVSNQNADSEQENLVSENTNNSENDTHSTSKSSTYIWYLVALVCIITFALLPSNKNPLQQTSSNSISSKTTIENTENEKCMETLSNYKPNDLINIYGDVTKQYHRNIETKSNITAILFDQGMLHLFGFNKPEGIRNLEAAISVDPECAMCYYGMYLCMIVSIHACIDVRIIYELQLNQ